MFFDRAMLAMGNILFLLGLLILIGPQKTLLFFARRQKLKGTAAFCAGIILILLRWPFFGFIIEVSSICIFTSYTKSRRPHMIKEVVLRLSTSLETYLSPDT